MKKAEKIGIIAKTTREESRQVVEKLVNYLRRKKAKFFLDEDTGTLIGAKGILKRDQIASKVDLLVVIGGDGTLLSAARSAGKTKTPILGINLGSLGFLTEVALDELYESIDRGLKGKLTIETRMMQAAMQTNAMPLSRSLSSQCIGSWRDDPASGGSRGTERSFCRAHLRPANALGLPGETLSTRLR